VWGIDISESMLAIAQEKIPHGNFSLQNMTSFTFPQQFDVILCVFDSINHLLNFTDWRQTFERVSQHLTTDGLFIFDINTITKLKRLIEVPVRVKQFGNNYLIMGTTDAGNNITNWNVKVFEHQEVDMYRMFEENIQEVSFPHTMIQEALQEYFPVVNIVDSDEYPPTVSNVNSTDKRSLEDANRLYFICKNSP
jgi:cyclopropane fatty-acyl-phospholipid synthase-like methyltransferase